MQRLDAHAVACEKQLPGARMNETERKLPVQPLDQLLAPLLVPVHQDLRVGLGGKNMARRGELRPKLEVVEDLAGLHHPDRRVLVVHRLVASRQVDDREPPHAQRDVCDLDDSLVIRPAVDHGIAHSLDELAAARRVTARDAADPAHLTETHRARTAGLPFVAACLWGVLSMISRTTYVGLACDS